MVKFTTLSAGGINYYQEGEPSSAKDGELWLPITETKVGDATGSTGATEQWSYSVHGTTNVNGLFIDESKNLIFSAGSDKEVVATTFENSTDWRHTLHTDVAQSIHAANGSVYSGGNDATVYAVNDSDGSQQWSHSLHSSNVNGIDSTSDTVYSVGYESDSVYAVAASDGTQNWSYTPPNQYTYDIEEVNGNIYVSNFDYLIKLDSNGNELWKYSASNGGVESISIADDVLYAGGGDALYSIDRVDGSENWTATYSDPSSMQQISAYAGVIYAVGYDIIQAFDASDGTKLWSVKNINNDWIRSIKTIGDRIYTGGGSGHIRKHTVDGATFVPADGGTGTPQLYYNGEWLQSQNAQTSGGSY